jgi:hypothetical protein
MLISPSAADAFGRRELFNAHSRDFGIALITHHMHPAAIP